MEHLDDLPTRDNNHKIQVKAESAFQTAISSNDFFIIQYEDRKDFGTDYQLELISESKATNIRVHVQLKGSNSNISTAKSSLAVSRTNLNYLLMQPDSIYVYYNLRKNILLARYADEVYQEYLLNGKNWTDQKSITIKFETEFDINFQKDLYDKKLHIEKNIRNSRLMFLDVNPSTLPKLLQNHSRKIPIPRNSKAAGTLLTDLYESNQDYVIFHSFDQFKIILGDKADMMSICYGSIINIALNGGEVNVERILEAIEFFKNELKQNNFIHSSIHYSIGNAFLALKEYEKARDFYLSALFLHDNEPNDGVQSCEEYYKNLGTTFEHLKNYDAAEAYYKRALELNPFLNEAHFSLGLFYHNIKQMPQKALQHLDQVIISTGSSIENSAVIGWRIELLFILGDTNSAFREINNILSDTSSSWVWPWCAKQVSVFGFSTKNEIKKALSFWYRYLQVFPDDRLAKKNHKTCLEIMTSK